MKSLRIFQNSKAGFLIFEALIALALMALLVPAALFLTWSNAGFLRAVNSELDSSKNAADLVQNGADEQLASSTSLYSHEYGASTCNLTPRNSTNGFVGATLYPVATSTSLASYFLKSVGKYAVSQNGFVYEVVEPAGSLPDFVIIDNRNPSLPTFVTYMQLNVKLSSLIVVGYYVYVAEENGEYQLLVIDIHDRVHPFIVSKLRLPLGNATTSPVTSSIFYDNNYVYLGTQKWGGNEFSIIRISNPNSPSYVGGFDTDSLINSIYENNGYAYLAMPSTYAQMDILDVHDPQNIADVSHFAPAGSAVLEGKGFAYNSGTNFDSANSTGTLYFFRSGGGFNNTNQYEFFSFNLAHDQYAQNPIISQDIPGGVYGAIHSNGYIFLTTGDPNSTFQIWKDDFSKEVYSVGLSGKPASMVCDHTSLIIEFSTPAGFATLIPY